MPNKLASQEAIADNCIHSLWTYLPDHLLLSTFQYLSPRNILNASQVCYQWHRVAMDEILWRGLFYRYYKIDRSIPMAPGMCSWRSEFKRLAYHSPMVESEVIREHRDQVLHVSFSHNGQMFATASKDGFIKVWNPVYPCQLKYCADMKTYTWKYTQFSQFNSNDTLLLVSGVHFGSHSTSGEIAVFSLEGEFELQCRAVNKPYDIFGAWYNNGYLLSGSLSWRGNFSSSSMLWLNKASQASESEHESVIKCLYQFLNHNASSLRTILVARCLTNVEEQTQPSSAVDSSEFHSHSLKDTEDTTRTGCTASSTDLVIQSRTSHAMDYVRYVSCDSENTVEYDGEYKFVEMEKCSSDDMQDSESEDDMTFYSEDSCQQRLNPRDLASLCGEVLERHSSGGTNRLYVPRRSFYTTSNETEEYCDKYLIFTMGEKTYTPHQIGIKRITAKKAKEIIEGLKRRDDRQPVRVQDDQLQQQADDDKFESVDHQIDLHGHIIGMCLSPDHRFLYVNSRSWPKGYQITDPLSPPPISQEIDIHVIDLETLTEVSTLLRSHRAFTPNDECFFIFLDVSSFYIASGAEDKKGYMWDRHYGICLRTFPHNDVVNSVAFNPCDSEVLVTVSDDNSIKIWRSKNRELQVKGHCVLADKETWT